MSDSGEVDRLPHIAFLPSSGMGHLTPFVRLAASLATHHCRLTFITTHPTVSLAESQLISRFLSAFPQITQKEFHILPFDPQTANSYDPFFLQFEAIIRSAHLLSPLLSTSSPPLSALVTDISVASAFMPITSALRLPNYVLFTSSANMLSLCAYFPTTLNSIDDHIHIPGLPPIPKSWLPPSLLDPTNLFAAQFTANGRKLIESKGIIINTFESLEPDSLAALNHGKVVEGMPPVIPIGPLVPCEFERGPPLAWLDKQPEGSVVLVSFGSRTAMSREQIRELGEGLERSGQRFLWVVKDKKVGKEDEEGVEEVVGEGLIERAREAGGLVVKAWVDQGAALGHGAVGGFVSHCGWNSVTEAAWHGVRMLAWPQGEDQRMIAEVVERSGLGMWEKSWGWYGGEVVVGREEIGRKIREMMEDEGLKLRAALVREEARRAQNEGGSSMRGLTTLIQMWNRAA